MTARVNTMVPPLPQLPRPPADLITRAYSLLEDRDASGRELTAMRVALAPYQLMGETDADAVENDEVRELRRRLADRRYVVDAPLRARARRAA